MATVVSAPQFAAILSEAGEPTDRRTATRWFSLWRSRGVPHVREVSGKRGGRGGVSLGLTLEGVAAYCRGELSIR